MSRALIPFLTFVAIAVFLGIGLTLKPGEVPSPFIDKPAPEFSLPVLNDAALNDSAAQFSGELLIGEPWILNVWASWCAACRDEHPLLNQLAARIKIVGLNYKDNRNDAINWLARFGNPYHKVAVDVAGDVGIEFGVYGVPETFIIDSAGIVRLKHTGPLTEQDITHTVLPLINQLQRKVDSPQT